MSSHFQAIAATSHCDEHHLSVDGTFVGDRPAAEVPTVIWTKPPIPYVVPILTPSNAHLPAYSTNCYHNSLSYVDTKVTTSPTASSPGTTLPSALSSRKPSLEDLRRTGAFTPSPPDLVKRRLASAFFAYFLCGWGDGS